MKRKTVESQQTEKKKKAKKKTITHNRVVFQNTHLDIRIHLVFHLPDVLSDVIITYLVPELCKIAFHVDSEHILKPSRIVPASHTIYFHKNRIILIQNLGWRKKSCSNLNGNLTLPFHPKNAMDLSLERKYGEGPDGIHILSQSRHGPPTFYEFYKGRCDREFSNAFPKKLEKMKSGAYSPGMRVACSPDGLILVVYGSKNYKKITILQRRYKSDHEWLKLGIFPLTMNIMSIACDANKETNCLDLAILCDDGSIYVGSIQYNHSYFPMSFLSNELVFVSAKNGIPLLDKTRYNLQICMTSEYRAVGIMSEIVHTGMHWIEGTQMWGMQF